MKIFDCFMFYDEEMLLDIRLNTLDKFVDKFIIVEAETTHTGKFKELRYDQLNRPQEYWDSFEKGIQKIIKSKDTQEDVVIRPSRPPQQTHHWASFIDIEHPKHVKHMELRGAIPWNYTAAPCNLK